MRRSLKRFKKRLLLKLTKDGKKYLGMRVKEREQPYTKEGKIKLKLRMISNKLF